MVSRHLMYTLDDKGKRVYTLTPVRVRFREKPRVIGSLVKPTSRSHP